MNRFELENRLIDFSASIINFVQDLPFSKSINHLKDQLLRSSSSAALNYGEAQGGESSKDFIHKLRIVLKELRESYVCLGIIHRSNIFGIDEKINSIIKENNELISIFVKSVSTAERNQKLQIRIQNLNLKSESKIFIL